MASTTVTSTSILPDDEYIVLHDVPILDEHAAPERQPPFDRLNEQLLHEICERNNRRMEDTGDEIPIVASHTIKGAPADEQPPIVGYAKNLYVGKFGNVNPRACIFARDWKIQRKHADLARSRPRRSIEIWPNTLEIDPIALCGATTPSRHLGQLHFAQEDKRITFQRDLDSGKENAMDEKDLIEKVLASLMETPIMKQFMAYMDQMNGAAAAPAAVGAEVQAPPATAPQGFQQETPPTVPVTTPTEEMPPAGAGIPPKKEGYSTVEDEKVRKLREQRDDEQVRYSQLESQLEAEKTTRKELEVQMTAVQTQLRREKYERALTQLQAVGIQFDRTEELDRLQHMSQEQFDSECERMKKHYKQVPIERRMQISEEMRDGGELIVASAFSKEDARQAVKLSRELMQSENLSYDQAYEKAIKKIKEE